VLNINPIQQKWHGQGGKKRQQNVIDFKWANQHENFRN
jgi:hypothetical protein